jgi:pantoate--beta-alanine ligase
MRTIRSVPAMAAWSEELQREGVRIGLVPTMGALHAGHQSLIRKARLSCDAVAVSLFVNPRQFGPGEDLSRYPRPFKADAALCRAEGVDLLFAPSRRAIYPPGFQTSVVVHDVARRWEGAQRPGHFEGVATVLAKLFSIVRPSVAFFGQKDFQQTAVVRRLVEDLNLGLRLVVCPTVRERDGLALSSRNRRLTPAQRSAAPALHEALQAGRTAIVRGVRFGNLISRAMQKVIAAEPLMKVDYLSVCDPDTLEPLARVTNTAILLGAVRMGRVRLIDNLLVRIAER